MGFPPPLDNCHCSRSVLSNIPTVLGLASFCSRCVRTGGGHETASTPAMRRSAYVIFEKNENSKIALSWITEITASERFLTCSGYMGSLRIVFAL